MTFNIALIKAVTQHANPEKNIAEQLSEILSIGKEAAYRRLRNEVPFSFKEAGKLALSLNFSLDQLISAQSSNMSVFELQFADSSDLFGYYTRLLNYYLNLCSKVEKSDTSKIMVVFNTLPASCFLNYDQLFRFVMYRNQHQLKSNSLATPFSEMQIPRELTLLQHKLANSLRKIRKNYFIIDWSVFLSFIRDVHYFYKLGLITPNEVEEIQKDLLIAINDLEQFTIDGSYPNGNSVSVYLSNIDFISSQLFIEYDSNYFVQQVLFSMNMLVSRDPNICLKQKSWIDVLIKYSTLITQSGEIERLRYFKTQRDYILNMTVFSALT